MASNPKTDLMAMFAAHDLLSAADRQEAQQPQPIALEMFDSVPGWAIVQAASNNGNAPLIREGEVVVAEPGAFYPTPNGLFVIEYVSKPQVPFELAKRTRRIVETRETPIGWWVGPIRQGDDGRSVYVSDGPYRDPNALAAKIVGRVVGILRTASFIDRMEGR